MKKPDEATVEYPLGRELDFLRRLWRLERALEQLSSRMESRLGVTAQQRFILRCVGKYPGMSAGQLATLLHVDPGTVSAALKRLEHKGLLVRRRDPRDQRRVALGLTARGQTLNRRAEGTVESAVARLFERFPAESLVTMGKVVDELTALLADELPRGQCLLPGK